MTSVLQGQQLERETIRDVLFGQSPTSMFANCRIPKRLTGEAEPARIGDHVNLQPPPKVQTPRLLRQATLPDITGREGAKSFTPKPRISAADLPVSKDSLARSKTTNGMPSSPRKQQSHDVRAGQLEACADEWQQQMPDVDRRLLEKVLRLHVHDNTGLRHSLKPKGTLLTDARRTVERWLESASEKERQVALRFFTSLAGNRLMGDSQDEQTARLQQVITTLQSPGMWRPMEGGMSSRREQGEELGERARRLRYVKLLDDDTKQQRWMHTTWHHLPNYSLLNPVTNSSSHYVRPHAAQHRHFVIHPDWA